MKVFARRNECKHIVWAGPLATTEATLEVADQLRGRPCRGCGGVIDKLTFVMVTKPDSTFDRPPAPRHGTNNLKKVSKADIQRSRRHLAALNARTDGPAAELAAEALRASPPEWRPALAKIPVGILPTYEPNAQCLRFKDSKLPVLVFHQGLSGYLRAMNQSIIPLVPLSADGVDFYGFVTDPKTRAALRVQAAGTALRFLGVGDPRSGALIEVPEVVRSFEQPFTSVMETFLLCHEYGHAVLNHADELLAVTPDFSVLERSRAMEHEADSWGQDAVIGAFTRGKPSVSGLDVLDQLLAPLSPDLLKLDIAYAAPCIALLYFEFLDVVEERLTRQGVRSGAESTLLGRFARRARLAGTEATHPSNQDRFQALFRHLSEQGNTSAYRWVGAFEELLEGIKAELDRLIDRTGELPGQRFARRFSWRPGSKSPRRGDSRPTAPVRPDSWLDRYEGDQNEALASLEMALDRLDGQATSLPFDEAQFDRYLGELRRQADEHYARNEYAEAEKLYVQMLSHRETVDSAPFHAAVAMCRQNLGDIAGAKAAYRRCLEIAPDSEAAAIGALSLANILVGEEDFAGAEPVLLVAVKSVSADFSSQARLWLGMIAHRRGDVETAIAAYQKVYDRRTDLVQFRGLEAQALTNLGIARMERGEHRAAAALFESAIACATDRQTRDQAQQNLEVARRG